MEQLELLHIADGGINHKTTVENTLIVSLKLNILIQWTQQFLSEMLCKISKNICPQKKELHTNVHSSFTTNIPKLSATQMSINR